MNDIERLIDEYQHNIELLEEDRKDDKITISNAYRVAKIGVYTKVIMDLKAIVEGESVCKAINELPSVNPQEPKTGYWDSRTCECSECGYQICFFGICRA